MTGLATVLNWKQCIKAGRRLTPIFKKEDETDRENYRPVSILSVPSKILESEVNDTIVDHVYQHNNLISDEQWAYRRRLFD